MIPERWWLRFWEPGCHLLQPYPEPPVARTFVSLEILRRCSVWRMFTANRCNRFRSTKYKRVWRSRTANTISSITCRSERFIESSRRSLMSALTGRSGKWLAGLCGELLFPRIGACSPLNAHKVAQRRYAAHRFDSSIFPVSERLDLVDHFAGVIERTNAGISDLPNTFQMDNAYLMMRMQRWQGRIASSTNQIWPCLSPFMFRSVLETMLAARAMSRWRSLMIREMLTKFSPRIADFPLEHGFPAQPVTWKNFYRFFSLATYFGGKVLDKISGKFALPRAVQSEHTNFDPRVQLWGAEQVKEVLRPATMELAASLDSAALEDFLVRSQRQDFALGEQWARMLSLECALRAAKSARKRLT